MCGCLPADTSLRICLDCVQNQGARPKPTPTLNKHKSDGGCAMAAHSGFSIAPELYRAWLRLAWFARSTFGVRARGIGWMADRVREGFDFRFQGAPFHFSPEAARSYCLIPAGIPNEPETHRFLRRVLDGRSGVLFIDVGASIGEFAIPMASHPAVSQVLAFEPHPMSCQALRASARLSPHGRLQIIQKGVAAHSGQASFDISSAAPTAAGLVQAEGPGGTADATEHIELCTLDGVVDPDDIRPVILLIDIEGGELDAMKGALSLIEHRNPLIIFEYNETTRRCFNLVQARELLGEGYRLFRMRSGDGLLDSQFDSTWNIVALPIRGHWRGLRAQPALFA